MNNDKCQYECKKRQVYEADYVWNLFTCDSENEKYLASIIDDSAIRLDKIIDADDKAKSFDKIKTIPTNFDEKKATSQAKKFIYFTFIFINYFSIIDSCYYLLVFDKISSKTVITISIHK